MVTVGIPKEVSEGERRVAATPETVKKMKGKGIRVVVESGAGREALISDEDYREGGAEIATDRTALWGEADILLKVQEPQAGEIDRMKEGAIVLSFFQPLQRLDLVERLVSKKVGAFSLEGVPRITRAQKIDALSSMATIAGYKSVILAANASLKLFPLLMTAAGTIRPARLFVIGAGVAGLQAIATARRLGAMVRAFDTRPVVAEQVKSVGGEFVSMGETLQEEEVQDKGGYAKELSAEMHRKEQELIAKEVEHADVVITTALIPGKPAPRLITKEMVQKMKPGSVIVDLAAPQGGNCEWTEPGEEVVKEGVTLIGPLNLPSTMPVHASQMLARNLMEFLFLLVKEDRIEIDLKDEIIAASLVTYQGEVRHAAIREKLTTT